MFETRRVTLSKESQSRRWRQMALFRSVRIDRLDIRSDDSEESKALGRRLVELERHREEMESNLRKIALLPSGRQIPNDWPKAPCESDVLREELQIRIDVETYLKRTNQNAAMEKNQAEIDRLTKELIRRRKRG